MSHRKDTRLIQVKILTAMNLVYHISSIIMDSIIPNVQAFKAFFLFVLRFNVPVNNFSVMLGQNHCFLGINQYPGVLVCLAQGHNMVRQVGSESDALPLCHHAPQLLKPSSVITVQFVIGNVTKSFRL